MDRGAAAVPLTSHTTCILTVVHEDQLAKAINLFKRKSIRTEKIECVASHGKATAYKLRLSFDSEELARTLKWLEGEELKFSFDSTFTSPNVDKQNRMQELNDILSVDLPMSPFADLHSKGVRRKVEASETPWFPLTSAEIDECNKKVLLYGSDVRFNYPGYERDEYRQRRYLLGQLAINYHHKNPLPEIAYTQEEKITWQQISGELSDLYEQFACKQFNHNLNELKKCNHYGFDSIPQIANLNEFIKSKTGFSLRPVAGYLTPRDFLYSLAFRIFPCTQYIRISTNVDYTPEPDCCHEILGHLPMIIDLEFSNLSHKIGLAAIGASEEDIEKLAKLYFFTLEFGLCMEDGKVKAIGAGLLSSSKELKHAVTCSEKIQILELERIFKAECMITSFQNQYFLAESYESMIHSISQFCETIRKPFEMTYDADTGSIEIVNCLPRTGKLLRDIESDVAIVFNVP